MGVVFVYIYHLGMVGWNRQDIAWQGGRGGLAHHGGCGRSSDALVNLPRRLYQRWPGLTEGCLVLLWTVLLLLLLLTSLLRLLLLLLLGSVPASDPRSHRE